MPGAGKRAGAIIPMSDSKRNKNQIKLRCTVCKSSNYYTRKNKKLVERKIALSKFCSKCRKHTPHKEAKI